jgi:signal transduction histidine kinase
VTALGKLFRTTAFKISLAYLVITSIGAAIVLLSIGWNVKSLIDQQVTQTVDADLVGLSEQYAEGGITRLVEIIDQRVKQPGAGLYLVTTHAGEPIVGNVASLPLSDLDKPGIVETTYRVKGERRRAMARVFELTGGFRLLVGHDLSEGDALRPILWHALLNSLVWLTIISTIGGLILARRVLRRVEAINTDARKIVEGDLTGRLPLAGTGDELDGLVLNLNAMLERIAELMAGLKEVSDNVAHDLKTPLTRLRTRAEHTLRLGHDIEDYRDALEKVIDDADGMIRIFDGLLMIARAEAGAGREGMIDFDVATVASDVGELYEPVAESRGILMKGEIDQNLVVHGSRELIGQALANLVDNALKYGVDGVDEADERPRRKEVTLSATRRGQTVEIAVADRGPGIAAADRQRVTDRFVRLENSRSRPGSGLGLSLVSAVARLHNGELRIEDNDPGLRIIIALPAVRVGSYLLPPPARLVEPSEA